MALKLNSGYKRQWGTESNTKPLSVLHERPSVGRVAMSRLAIVATVGLWVVYVVTIIIKQFLNGQHGYQFTLQAFFYGLIVTLLTLSALLYLVARQGALQRFARHVRVPKSQIDDYFADKQPSLTVLIPSYNEEPEVVRKTIISAALQEYPDSRIVLLLDNPPDPKDDQAADLLETMRLMPKTITQLFEEPHRYFNQALRDFRKQQVRHRKVERHSLTILSDYYRYAAKWLRQMAKREKVVDHVDNFFVNEVLLDLAHDLDLTGKAIREARDQKSSITYARAIQLYLRLVWIFAVRVEVFERKQYINLSHEPNKAMNLNSYIGLMGGAYLIKQTPDGMMLEKVSRMRKGCLDIPDCEYLLTLDADSILLREYCERLIFLLEQPENARLAVAQTPYSSFRGAPTRLERLAGATTDLQHIIHQGMTRYGATFWVGANAVIRKWALEDIVEKERIGGYEIRRYIQDRTVIEDTESSVDLVKKGWQLINYPERLSYSATPPDFGSLIVQRRRWADGGLLIVPKLWSQIRERRNRNETVAWTEQLLRLNYMASIAWSNVSLVLLLAYPYDGRVLSPYVVLAALPYFLAMASDLKYCGYKRLDALRIYGFNLILMPVNLAGVIKSLQQSVTNKKIAFARTPKVKNRTVASIPYLLAPLLILGFSGFVLYRDILGHYWVNAAFAAFNALLVIWAVVAYIGLWHLCVDLIRGIVNWVYVETKTKPAKQEPIGPSDPTWQTVLYHGTTGLGRSAGNVRQGIEGE